MAKPKSTKGSSGNRGTQPSPQTSEEERQRLIAESAYYRAMMRGFQNGNPADDWLAAEREINRLLPSPAQQKRELAAYQKLRADVQKLLTDTKDTLNVDTFRQAIDEARTRIKQAGEHTVESIDKAIASIEKEMIGASQHMGARLDNLSGRSADLFYIWRDRSGRFLADAGRALSDWVQDISTRLEQQTYRTGDIAASGELECMACGGHLRLETPAHVPLCPKCRKTEFRRIV
jgi:hypothetical protein